MINHFTRTDRDFANLVLADGRPAESLRLVPLFKELTRMGIPGIRPEMGKADLLGAYDAAVRAVADDLRPPGALRPADLSQIVAKQAAEFIARQAAGGLGTDTAATKAPQMPIASTRT